MKLAEFAEKGLQRYYKNNRYELLQDRSVIEKLEFLKERYPDYEIDLDNDGKLFHATPKSWFVQLKSLLELGDDQIASMIAAKSPRKSK